MIKALWNDPVWSKVIATVLIGVFTLIGTLLLGLWPLLISALLGAWNWIISDIKLPLWFFMLLLGAAGFLFLAIFSNALENYRLKHKDTPPWKDYTSEHFFGARFEWQWSHNNTPKNLLPLCLQCDAIMTKYDTSAYMVSPTLQLICENCGYKGVEIEGTETDLNRKILIQVELRMRQLNKGHQHHKEGN